MQIIGLAHIQISSRYFHWHNTLQRNNAPAKRILLPLFLTFATGYVRHHPLSHHIRPPASIHYTVITNHIIRQMLPLCLRRRIPEPWKNLWTKLWKASQLLQEMDRQRRTIADAIIPSRQRHQIHFGQDRQKPDCRRKAVGQTAQSSLTWEIIGKFSLTLWPHTFTCYHDRQRADRHIRNFQFSEISVNGGSHPDSLQFSARHARTNGSRRKHRHVHCLSGMVRQIHSEPECPSVFLHVRIPVFSFRPTAVSHRLCT